MTETVNLTASEGLLGARKVARAKYLFYLRDTQSGHPERYARVTDKLTIITYKNICNLIPFRVVLINEVSKPKTKRINRPDSMRIFYA